MRLNQGEKKPEKEQEPRNTTDTQNKPKQRTHPHIVCTVYV